MNQRMHVVNQSTINQIVRAQSALIAQRGVVLFFSLIALVAMSLAAVALIRSVDTNNMIAGNLGFKQSTIFSSDTGIVAAMDWVNANQTLLNTDSTANGYYASYSVSASAKSLVDANGVDFDANGAAAGIEDSQGNSIRYIVHRMCDAAGSPTTVHCLKGPLSDVKNDHAGKGPNIIDPQPTIMYRVTARVVGPKNTVSYLQTFVY